MPQGLDGFKSFILARILMAKSFRQRKRPVRWKASDKIEARVRLRRRPPANAREWLDPRTNKHGYLQLDFKVKGMRAGQRRAVFRIPVQGGGFEKVTVPIKLATIGDPKERAVPVRAFYNRKSKRLLVVTREERQTATKRGDKLVSTTYLAHSLDPFGRNPAIHLENMFLYAVNNIYPESRVVVGGDFRWFPENIENPLPAALDAELARLKEPAVVYSGSTVPPKFIERKGFGLFLNYLRELEFARRGIRLTFGQIDKNLTSMKFARKRGYREITEEERRLIRKLNPGFLIERKGIALMARTFEPEKK